MEHLLSERARGATSSAIRDLLRLTAAPGVLSLAGGLPAPELFPVHELRAIADAILTNPMTAVDALQYGPTEGTDELRAHLRVQARRDGVTHDREVLVTSGSQQGLDLLARTLVDREDVVIVESPSYLGALQALRAYGPNIVPVEADADGLDPDHLADLLARGVRPKLCYVVPNFSNPSGATMPEARRARLAQLAARYGFLVVEDDPYGALRHRGTPPAPIGSHGDHVVSLGSTSKTLAPGLRVGWVHAPAWLHGALVKAKQTADLHTSSFAQAIVARALVADWYPAHVARAAATYARRADVLADALAARPDVFAPVARPDGGLFLWAECRGDVDTTAALPRALARGVAYVPGGAFSAQARYRSHVRLSFATLAPDELAAAADRLAAVLARGVRQAAVA